MDEEKFYSLTFAEVQRYAKGWSEREKRSLQLQAQMDYKLALTIGAMVGKLFSEEAKIPEIDEIYPELMGEIMERQRAKELRERMMGWVERFGKQDDEGSENESG